MKTTRKALLLICCAALLVAGSVMGTLAYLTDTDQVVNTFSVGNVDIKLDEAKANSDGSLVTGAEAGRVQANSYKLLPGHTYNKDPMVTVLEGSEESYIKMTVTISKAAALDAIFAPDGADLLSIFSGYDSSTWLYQGNTKSGDNRTYTFWYKETVDALDADVALDALFDQIVVPGSINNSQLSSIAGMTITVNAYAIQADGFDDAAAAWAAYAA